MPLLVLEHSDHCRCARLAAILRDHGHVLDVRRLHDGDSIPQELDGIDGVISMGGPMSPDDDSQPKRQKQSPPEGAQKRSAEEANGPLPAQSDKRQEVSVAVPFPQPVPPNPFVATVGVDCFW